MKSDSVFVLASKIFAVAVIVPVQGKSQSLDAQFAGGDVSSIFNDEIDNGAVGMTNFDKAMAHGQSIREMNALTLPMNRSIQSVRQSKQAYQ